MLQKSSWSKFKKSKKAKRPMVPRRKKIAAKTHLFKRIGQTIILDNADSTTPGYPRLQSDGLGSAVLGSAIASPFSNTVDVGMSTEFRMDCVTDYTDFTKLFDRYKIVGIKLKVFYQQNTAASSQFNSTILPTLFSAWDFDDAAPPTTATDVTTKGYCKSKILNGNAPYSVYLKPRISMASNILKEGVLSTVNVTSSKPQWLDCNVPNVPHYGVKFWVTNLPVSQQTGGTVPTVQLRIQPTYYLALKDTQ